MRRELSEALLEEVVELVLASLSLSDDLLTERDEVEEEEDVEGRLEEVAELDLLDFEDDEVDADVAFGLAFAFELLLSSTRILTSTLLLPNSGAAAEQPPKT